MTDTRYYLIFPDPTRGPFSLSSEETETLLGLLHIDSKYLLSKEPTKKGELSLFMADAHCSILKTPEDLLSSSKDVLLYFVKNRMAIAELEPEAELERHYVQCKDGKSHMIFLTREMETIIGHYGTPSLENMAEDINSSDDLQKNLIKKSWFGNNKLKPFMIEYYLYVRMLTGQQYAFGGWKRIEEDLPELEKLILLPLRTP